MKRILILAVLILGIFGAKAQIQLVHNGQSQWHIHVLAPSTDDEAYLAAQTLSRYILQSTGCQLPITQFPADTNDKNAILIQRLVHPNSGNGTFHITATPDRLILSSASDKGLIYAAYELLEQYAGMRFYTPDAVVLPTATDLVIPLLDSTYSPSFTFRDVLYWYPNQSQEYADFHRLHNTRDLNRDWGMFVHTFRHLIPADRYYDRHPEWFSETEGRRLRDGQLCLANTEMLEELCRNLDSLMRQRPDAHIWSVSNNDNYNVCTCPQCRHLDSLYGGPSGTLIHFINQVAERFPDKIISTLGYQFTRQAPQSDIKPRDNVNIMFCSIECDRSQPIAQAPSEAQFRKDMQEWSTKTDNIFMWDYVVQFRNMMAPFPNLHVLQPNLKFFHTHGVRQMFEQGCSSTPTAWMEIRNYLIAKLMWNVDADVDSLMRDFCQGYYGAAGPTIYGLMKKMEQDLIASGKRLDIYGYPVDHRDGFLLPVKQYKDQVKQAYTAVSGNSDLTDRIRFWELSLDYTILENGLSSYSVPEYRKIAQNFVSDCERLGVKILMEMGITPAEYLVQINNYLAKLPADNKAYNCQVVLKHAPDKNYYCNGAPGLCDGKIGLLNYFKDWLGFYGNPMDATLDLGQPTEINEVMMDFYNFPLSWIFVPKSVEVYVSNNGRRWQRIGTQHGHECGTDVVSLARPGMQHFSFPANGKQARYVRVVATPLDAIPDWHRAAGKPCWTFCDEIIIK